MLCVLVACVLTLSFMMVPCSAEAVQTVSADTPVYKGVDVSQWQGDIDWSKAAAEIDFAILRVGSSGRIDSYFNDNVQGCIENDIPYGVYYYSTATDVDAALSEAELVISALEGLQPDLPVFFDVEDEPMMCLPTEELQEIVLTFCQSIEAAGFVPGLYSFVNYMEDFFSGEEFEHLMKWIVQVDEDACTYSGDFTIWQYSWAGSVGGISGDVDLDYYYGDLFGSNVTEEFKINSASLKLSNDISVLYYVTVPTGYSNPRMVFDFMGKQIEVSDYTISDDGRYCFRFENIRPQFMGENICATLYASMDGAQVSDCVEKFSIRDYCVYQLEAYSSEIMQQLLSDILVYGEKAQFYTGYDVENLVTAGLELSPSTFSTLGEERFKFLLTGEKNETADFTSVSLMLLNSVAVRFYISTEDAAPYTYRISIDGIDYDYTSEDLVYKNGRYYLDFCKFGATRFDQEITAVILLDGQQIGRSVTYSVNSYIYTNQNVADEVMRELLHAMYNYGCSANLYQTNR